MKRFSWHERKENLEKIEGHKFDLCVIGGGITGAGVARDAAMRGLDVLLVESSDFASGTSSRSSKLIHGGIRYLENLEFHLVFEALSERSKLFSMAPHLVHPLRFLIPLYKSSRVPPWKMGLGLWLYDALALFRTPEMHQLLSVKETEKLIPALSSKDLNASFIYSDAYMDDDRLVLETLRSANEAGATLINYCKALEPMNDSSGKINRLKIRDEVSGKNLNIEFSQLVSTVGPWTDIVGKSLNQKWKSILRPTKGVHLTFRKEDFSIPNAVVMATEQRIVFAIPRHEMVILGTTDTDFKGDPSAVRVEESDVAYLLGVVRKYFPKLDLKKENIVSSYAGVRPLVNDGADNEGKVSREHTIFRDETGVVYAAGGKYTTYRQMSEDIVDEVIAPLTMEAKSRLSSCQTQASLNPLVPSDVHLYEIQIREDLEFNFKLSSAESETLFQRHGLESLEMARLFFERYGRFGRAVELEALQALETTMCRNLTDFLTRRVPYFLSLRDHGQSDLKLIAPIFVEYLKWTSEELKVELKRFEDYTASELSWKK